MGINATLLSAPHPSPVVEFGELRHSPDRLETQVPVPTESQEIAQLVVSSKGEIENCSEKTEEKASHKNIKKEVGT